jgi:pimeloyl-ACP methyl ester carboxylesterase
MRRWIVPLAAAAAAFSSDAFADDGLWARTRCTSVALYHDAAGLVREAADSTGHAATVAWRESVDGATGAWTWTRDGVSSAAERVADGVATARRAVCTRACAMAEAAAPGRGLFVLKTPLEAAREGSGLDSWSAFDPSAKLPERVVLLVHGLDEPGSVWAEMAPALQREGYTVARLDYLNDQALADSAAVLDGALAQLRAAGVTRVDLVCHSMGGLIALDVLTRGTMYAGRAERGGRPRLGRVITLGTPARGSWWAHLAPVADATEHVQRWWHSEDMDPRLLLGFLCDGDGQAACDLLPGSAYLAELAARPAPGVPVTAVAGYIAEVDPHDLDGLKGFTVVRRTIGDEGVEAAAASLRSAFQWLGDGVVSTRSAAVPGAELVKVLADHRSLVRTIGPERALRRMIGSPQEMPPGIAVTLEKLADDRAP